jgi:NADPH:quinone reductase-like Zn-dependent oxidoreductase
MVSISLRALCVALIALSAIDASAADAPTMRRYELKRAETGYDLGLATVPRPTPAKDQVLVRIRAVSLNHRDLYALQRTGGADSSGRIPVSDGAGEVVAIGADVKQFKVGDRVAGTFFEQWIDGKPTPAALMCRRA